MKSLFLGLCLLAGCSCDETISDHERPPFTEHLEPQILPSSTVMPMLVPGYAPPQTVIVQPERDHSDLFLGLMLGNALAPSSTTYVAPTSHTTINQTTVINKTVRKSVPDPPAAPASVSTAKTAKPATAVAAPAPRAVSPTATFRAAPAYRPSPMRSGSSFGGGRRGK